MDTSMITTTANRNLVTRSVANGKLFNHCRRGWNWRFIISEDRSTDDCPITTITAKLMWRGKWEIMPDVLSGYTYGEGRREDAAVDTIRMVIGDFLWHAREAGVGVKSVADRWFDKLVISASPDSKLVRNVADMLARLNRVVVDIRN